MAAGQLKVTARRTYGVTNGAADRSSPDSSGSPQLFGATNGEGFSDLILPRDVLASPVDFAQKARTTSG
jgi:hypothetical protein